MTYGFVPSSAADSVSSYSSDVSATARYANTGEGAGRRAHADPCNGVALDIICLSDTALELDPGKTGRCRRSHGVGAGSGRARKSDDVIGNDVVETGLGEDQNSAVCYSRCRSTCSSLEDSIVRDRPIAAVVGVDTVAGDSRAGEVEDVVLGNCIPSIKGAYRQFRDLRRN